jgi:hypothetical protein
MANFATMSIPRKIAVGAVLTGDIVNSTKLFPKQEAELTEKLGKLLALFMGGHLHEFFRGDSFQVYMEEPREALRMVLACRAVAISIAEGSQEEIAVASDIRISIGVGEVSLPIRSLGMAKGQAFLLSGRRFDQLQQSEQRLAISCGEPIADIGFQIMADYLDSIYSGMTAKQANVIINLLQGITQHQLAITLNKSKSTISQLANAGRWSEIERLLKQYEMLINQLP